MKDRNLIAFVFLFAAGSLSAGEGTDSSDPRGKGDYHLGFRVAPRISTLGVGVEMGKGITPNFGVRMGLNYFTYDYSDTVDVEGSAVDANAELSLKSIALLGDWHPFKGSFRLTAGVLFNGNRVQANGRVREASGMVELELDGVPYQVKGLQAEAKFNVLAPYLGFGWDSTFGDHEHWGFTFDLGVVYTGSPELSFTATGGDAGSNVFKEELAKFEKEIEDEIAQYARFWPVVSTGLVYQF